MTQCQGIKGVLVALFRSRLVTDGKAQKRDPGDTQVFCIVASKERSGKEGGGAIYMYGLGTLRPALG